MPMEPTEKAPVEAVGGVQDEGPWPVDVDEIQSGQAYNRLVELSDGTVQEVQAAVTEIKQIVRQDGTPTDGYVVMFTYDDPTLDGGTL